MLYKRSLKHGCHLERSEGSTLGPSLPDAFFDGEKAGEEDTRKGPSATSHPPLSLQQTAEDCVEAGAAEGGCGASCGCLWS